MVSLNIKFYSFQYILCRLPAHPDIQDANAPVSDGIPQRD
jgi:hypothetical protein